MDDVPEHLSTTQARAGVTPGVARYALICGLLLAIVALIVIVVFYMVQ